MTESPAFSAVAITFKSIYPRVLGVIRNLTVTPSWDGTYRIISSMYN